MILLCWSNLCWKVWFFCGVTADFTILKCWCLYDQTWLEASVLAGVGAPSTVISWGSSLSGTGATYGKFNQKLYKCSEISSKRKINIINSFLISFFILQFQISFWSNLTRKSKGWQRKTTDTAIRDFVFSCKISLFQFPIL